MSKRFLNDVIEEGFSDPLQVTVEKKGFYLIE
jgi:hypothetical protein